MHNTVWIEHAGLQLITFSGGGVRRRQVVIGARRVDVTDYELITKYQREVDSSVEAYQRSVVYLQPQVKSVFYLHLMLFLQH